ncbi:MAG: GGDEF domain-containing protein [Gammaproteobacteria bacterium]|nr:GGDEF domain-containing protein [Gammaproteobacteria bacterium]
MHIKKMSIKRYALSFILLYILIFFLSSTIAYLDIQKLNDDISQANLNSGKTELIEAIVTLVSKNIEASIKFSNWDEVRQQIDNSEHYSYWQTHRLLNAGILPDNFIEASIYDNQGKTLDTASTLTLPDQVNLTGIKSFFSIEDNTGLLTVMCPVIDESKENSNKTIGYIATKSKILEQLLKIKQYDYIQVDSVKLQFQEKDHIEVNEFINYFQFEIKESSETLLISRQIEQILLKNTSILIVFALIFYFLISYFLSRPLRQISSYIDALNSQPELQLHQKLDINFHIYELENVKHSLSLYQKKLQLVYTNLDEKNHELWEMAHHDALTGALNRRAFEEHWANIADLFSKSRCHVSLILFDINLFKSINDSYGHPIGDEVLKKIAYAIQKVLRKGEKTYRIGGDEFAAILHNCKPEDAILIANRCQMAISSLSFTEQGIKEPVRASIGVAHNDINNPASISELLWQADIAVYTAKKPGHSHVVTYSDKIKDISTTILSSKINNIVFNAIETGDDIKMFYQPIINLDENRVEYYEALLRIKANNEIIPPNKIFQLIEAKKLDYELDTAIFRQISSDLKSGLIPPKTGISVNVSGPSIISENIVEQLLTFVPYLSHYKIVLEITETSLITNINHASDNISQLKKLGFLIALDDFGSGYSSISYLSSMPVDIVKFDITLIRQLEDDKQFSIISHLAKMIGETGHLLVAEGIETEELKEKIKQLGFNYAQGYLYGKPSPTIKY